MKKNLIIAALPILIFGCMNNDEKSDAFGNFEADPIIVSTEVSGKILQMNVEKGQKIEAGFVAVVIDTIQTDLKLKQIDAQKASVMAQRQTIQSQVAVYEEQIKNLQINEKRVAQMVKDQAATQKQLDDITGQISVIEKQIESTKTQFISINRELEVLDIQRETTIDLLGRSLIQSPVSGTVLETYSEQGELATPGKALFKIASLDELTLKVYVSGAQLPHIKISQQVSVIIDKSANLNQTLSGVVTWISSEAEFTPKIIQTKEERVKLVYAVKVAVKNDGTLKIGMPGEIKISTDLSKGK